MAIDNGWTDGTGVYLAGVKDSSPRGHGHQQCPQHWLPGSRQPGIEGWRKYLVLLNNDAVVTDAWLEQLIGLAEIKTDLTTEGTENTEREGTTNQTNLTSKEKRIGLVGPMSNYASPPQWVENVPYKGLEEMEGFARRWREEHRGQWFTTGKIPGFCLLVKRIVYETIGGLDERFGLGFFDDDDLAERTRRAGFELAVAHDLFIHHFGSRTFAEKWGTTAVGQSVSLRPWPQSGNGPQMTQMNADPEGRGKDNGNAQTGRSASSSSHLRSSASSADRSSRASVSLTMIVKDEERQEPYGACGVRPRSNLVPKQA